MSGFPLLLIPLAICNIIAFLMSDVRFDVQLFELPLRSGDVWAVQLGHALVALALLLLMLELLRSARAGGKFVTDHLLSLVIFGAAAAEFVLLPKFGNSTFFLLTLITLVDFLAGLGLRRRRRVVETVVAEPVRAEPVRAEPVRAEPVRVEPAREAPSYQPTPASVIVPPPPAPDPVPLPKPDTAVTAEVPHEPAPSGHAAPTIDVTPSESHDGPARSNP